MADAYVNITYHSEHGTAPSAISVKHGTVYTAEHLPTLTASGYVFEGWYSTSTFDEGTLFSVGDIATVSTTAWSNVTLYAKWSVAITVSSLLTNLADELRDLTNTSDKMGLSVMAEHVADANAEVDEQSAVVDELMAALQGKSVPGGGSVETCELTVTNCMTVYYTGVENGTPVMKESVTANVRSEHVLTVCRNSVVACLNHLTSEHQANNATLLATYVRSLAAFSVTGETASIAFVGSND